MQGFLKSLPCTCVSAEAALQPVRCVRMEGVNFGRMEALPEFGSPVQQLRDSAQAQLQGALAFAAV